MNCPANQRSNRSLTRLMAGLGLGLCLSGLHAAPVVLHLRNGDRLTGEIIRETADKLTVQSPLAGRISLSKSEIVRREPLGTPAAAPPTVGGAAPAVAVAPMTPAVPVATAAPPAAPTAPGTPKASVAGVSADRTPAPTEPLLRRSVEWVQPFLTNWHGNIGLGMNLGFGTTDRQTFFANANAVHTWDRVVNNLSYNAAYGLVNEVEAANRMDGVIKTDVFFGTKRKLYAYNQVLGGYDTIRLIDQRVENGVGLGYRVFERKQLSVNAEFGGQYQRFSYSQQADRSIWSVRFGQNLNWRPTERLTVTERLQFLPSVTDLQDYHARFELIATYPLFKRITISLNVINEYESLPARGVDNNDLQITTNVNVVF